MPTDEPRSLAGDRTQLSEERSGVRDLPDLSGLPVTNMHERGLVDLEPLPGRRYSDEFALMRAGHEYAGCNC